MRRLIDVRHRLPALLLVVAVLSAAVPAIAQTNATRLEATAGIGGFVAPHRPVEVVASISSDLLFTGTLEVVQRGVVSRVSVEVPAGGAKDYRVTMPPPIGNASVRLSLIPDGGDESVAGLNLALRMPDDRLLVGILGSGVDDRTIKSARVSVTDAEVEVVQLAPAHLEADLSPLAYLVLNPVEATGDALKTWIEGGGRTVVDSSQVDRLALDLPAGIPWGDNGVLISDLGRGEVVAVPGLSSLDAAGWSSVLRPAPMSLSPRDVWQTPDQQLMQSATNGGDQRIPTLPWLLAAVVGFAVLIGPVNFFVLRKLGRREWAWVTIPSVSLLAVIGFWVAGRQVLQSAVVNHATVVVAGQSGLTGRSALALAAGAAGKKTLTFPQDWLAYPSSAAAAFDQFGNPLASPPGAVTGPGELEFELAQLGVAGVQALWTGGEVSAPLVSADIVENRLDVTVDNTTSPLNFWAWGVAGQDGVSVASEELPAGRSGSISHRRNMAGQFGAALGDAVIQAGRRWEEPFVWDRVGVLGSAVGFFTTEFDHYFFGYTDDLTLPVSVDGRPVDVAGSAIVVVPIDVAEKAGAPGTASAELVGAGTISWVDWGQGFLFLYTTEMTVSFSVPIDLINDPVLTVSNVFGEIPRHFEAWNWTEATFEEVGQNQPINLDLYRSSIGEVLVRALAGGQADGLPEFFELPMSPLTLNLEWPA